jgi:hypothetical protein
VAAWIRPWWGHVSCFLFFAHTHAHARTLLNLTYDIVAGPHWDGDTDISWRGGMVPPRARTWLKGEGEGRLCD